MKNYKKIIVCCPRGESGGPELLHQLVDALRMLGHSAFVSYYPFDENFNCSKSYQHYNAPVTILDDSAENLIIVPEVFTWILKRIFKADTAVWWLSVDNYFLAKHESLIVDFYIKYKSLIRKWRVPVFKLKNCQHFHQSFYAKKFLESSGITSYPLTDYLGESHLKIPDFSLPRRNIVVFNPIKGIKKTQKLRDFYPEIEFVAIQNMSSIQVSKLLKSAKIYIDFGYHPGKDRLPREAAMAGCCVITGLCGSAKFKEDVSIPDMYKLNDSTKSYITNFKNLVDDIFLNYSSHIKNFESYRKQIMNEPEVFKTQVAELFGYNL